MKRGISFDEFVRRAREVHADNYLYHDDKFFGMAKKATITCQIHGDFDQRADMHCKGQDCPKCGYANREQNFAETPRKIAQKEGKPTYWTGEPCPNGHVVERRTHNGECVDCMREGNRTRMERLRREQPDKVREYKKAEYERNKATYRKSSMQWAKDNPNKIKQSAKKHRDNNKESCNILLRNWRRNNPAKYRQQKYRRRMLEVLAEGSFTEDDLIIMLEQQNGFCLGPNCETEIVDTFTVDHKVPLSRGGNNDPDNLQLLCRSCNSAKGIQTDDEWRDAGPTGL